MTGKSRRSWKWSLLAGLLAAALAGASASGPGVESDPEATARIALEQSTGIAWIMDADPRTGAVTFAAPKDGAFALPAAGSRAEAALDFLSRHRKIFGMQDPEHDWVVQRQNAAGDGSTHVRFAQAVDHVPVHGATWDAHFDSAGRLTSTSGHYVSGASGVSTKALRTAAAAAALARAHVAAKAGLPVDAFETGVAELEIYPLPDAGPVLAWRVPVSSTRSRLLTASKVHLDDRSGTVLAVESTVIQARAEVQR